MNFHKTIGYLAAFLLMVGLGAPDSFAQDEKVSSISLTVSPRTLRDSTTADGGGNPVTVTARLTVNLDAEAGAPGREVTVIVEVSADETEGNLSDVDSSYEVSGGGSHTVTVPEDATRGTETVELVLTMSHDDDSEDEEVMVTATVAADDAVGEVNLVKTAKITVTDHSAELTADAVSARGYQVHLTAPTGATTAKAANGAVKVQVRRKRGLGKEFGAFTSIKVALHNLDDDDKPVVPLVELYSLTIGNNRDLGTLALSRVRSDQLLVATDNNEAAGNTDVTPNTTLDAGNTRAYLYTGIKLRCTRVPVSSNRR